MISVNSRFLLIFLEIWSTHWHLSYWILDFFCTIKELVISSVLLLTGITTKIVVFGRGVEEGGAFSFATSLELEEREGEQAWEFSSLRLAGRAVLFSVLRERGRFEFDVRFIVVGEATFSFEIRGGAGFSLSVRDMVEL